jgi:hypothetical protein
MEEIMKTKPFLNAVMAALIAVIFSALTGCAGVGAATGGAATDPAAAKRLAANINAVKAGSAKADGGTVTLSAGVTLETALTVPAGVTLSVPAGLTLDLTKETLTLGDNAVLTVNGTVNTRGYDDGVGGSFRFNGTATINGSGTIYLKSKGELLYIGKDKKLTLDGVTLAGLEDNNNSLVFVDESGELVMKSGAITGNTRIASKEWAAGGGVLVGEKGRFTMEGGAISGNTVKGKWSRGGGVHVEGAFTMNGGTISGNIVTDSHPRGGGVHVESDQNGEVATFILAGGEISGNMVINVNDGSDAGDGGNGGGVYVHNALFTMKGGAISGNSVTAPNGSGGGVRVDERSTFIMEGGAISGNSANGTKWSGGGGVYVNGGDSDVSTATFIMKGGRIQGSEDSGGFTKNTVSSEKSAAIWVWNSTVQWGTGGTYTKGGVSQTGGSDILSIPAKGTTATNDTLIAIPAR